MYFCAPGVGKGLSVKKQLSKGKSFSNPLSAVDKVVAQVSNLLYRRASSLPAVRTVSRARTFGRSADWKPALRRTGRTLSMAPESPQPRSCRQIAGSDGETQNCAEHGQPTEPFTGRRTR